MRGPHVYKAVVPVELTRSRAPLAVHARTTSEGKNLRTLRDRETEKQRPKLEEVEARNLSSGVNDIVCMYT